MFGDNLVGIFREFLLKKFYAGWLRKVRLFQSMFLFSFGVFLTIKLGLVKENKSVA